MSWLPCSCWLSILAWFRQPLSKRRLDTLLQQTSFTNGSCHYKVGRTFVILADIGRVTGAM